MNKTMLAMYMMLVGVKEYIRKNVKNPYSTMSNLTYACGGIFSFKANPIMGILQILLSIASSGFHWVRDDCWHKADIVMIYYQFSVLSLWLWFGNWGIIFGFILGGIAHWSFKNYSRYSQQIIGVLGVLTLAPLWINAGWINTYPIIIWFGLALAVSYIALYFDPDEDGKVYDAFHSIWHIFSGIGIYEIVMVGYEFVTQF